MATTLVLRPDLPFARLARILATLGWRRDTTRPTTPDTIPGEPELAGWRWRGGPRLSYTFNPVCSLRVLDVGDSSATRERALRRRLPLLEGGGVEALLDDPEPRRVLLGLLAARALELWPLMTRAAALADHAEPAVAEAARRTAKDLERVAYARAVSLEGLRAIAAEAEPLLRALLGPQGAPLVAALRPRPEDYARVFAPEVVDRMRAYYDARWDEDPPEVFSETDASELTIDAATAGALGSENEVSRPFPGRYRAVAEHLEPSRVWLTWCYHRPGESAGVRFDGLVWVDDHWAWCPKPYRAL